MKKNLALFLAGIAAMTCMVAFGHVNLFAALVVWMLFDVALSSRMVGRTGKCYANSFGTLSSALILQEALALLFTKRPVLNLFSTGFSDENGVQAKYQQQVITRTKTVATVGNFGDAATNANTVDVPVTLNQWKQILLTFTPQQYEATNRDLIQEQAEPIAAAIGNYIVDSVASTFTQANFGANKTVKALGWDYTHLTAVRAALMGRGVPDVGNRFYIASSPVYQSLLDDPMIVAFFNNQMNAQAIATGHLPKVAGFGIDEYPNLTTATGDNTVLAISGTPGSAVVASRAPQGPGKFSAQFPGNVGYITDPKSNFSIRVSEWIDTAFNANVRVDWIMGSALGQVNEGQLITNA